MGCSVAGVPIAGGPTVEGPIGRSWEVLFMSGNSGMLLSQCPMLLPWHVMHDRATLDACHADYRQNKLASSLPFKDVLAEGTLLHVVLCPELRPVL